ncbi:Thiamin-phosphate pyrophosphorylase [Minicystis rosea]|nr:Thiamin-phosphate pyrophosphorylase [Minicystis rosea]
MAGNCQGGCWIGGQFHPPSVGGGFGTDVCQICDPSISKTSFAYEGGPCHANNELGNCQAGICRFDGGACPGAECRDCTVTSCNGGLCYGLTREGTCSDDGDPCTVDQCSQGTCGHFPSATGPTCGGG